MSVETVATATEETVTAAAVEPRKAVTGLSRTRGNAVLRIADETAREDESRDSFYVLEDYYSASSSPLNVPSVTVYNFDDLWNVGSRVRGTDGNYKHFPATNVMEIIDLEYRQFGRLMRIKSGNRENNKAVMYADYIPSDLMHNDESLAGMTWPHTGRAMLELVGVSDDFQTVDIAVKAMPETGDGDLQDRGTHTFPVSILRNLSTLSESDYKRSYALAKEYFTEGQIFEYVESGELFRISGFNYGYAVAEPLNSDGTVTENSSWGNRPSLSIGDLTNSNTFVKVADTWEEFQKSQPSDEQLELLKKLSINTVSSALKHADRNDYCSETAVALASAGHSLPELRVKGTITLEVDFTSKDYMLLRKLFGATDGRPDEALARMFTKDATADDKRIYSNLQSRSNGALPDMGQHSKVKESALTSELVWKAPRIRK
ncbi:hypothetical protein RINGS_86 [Arthrobacter phage Rings]|uniref:Uncharacterized protein n=1 Tax=Arthrobacter phage Rings TaxID=1772313 RepID=A0A0U4JP77_9CAUD|nr:hypothetical protein RINGS_86 [Arthrobacter phage Rings]